MNKALIISLWMIITFVIIVLPMTTYFRYDMKMNIFISTFMAVFVYLAFHVFFTVGFKLILDSLISVSKKFN